MTAFTLPLTGVDDLAETRAVNDQTEKMLDQLVPLPVENDPIAARDFRRHGGGGFPPLTLLPDGRPATMDGVPVRVFKPPTVRGVFLHLHGGGTVIGSADGQDVRLWQLAQSAQVAVVSVDYRLAPEHPHPAAADDCERVARWLVTHARDEFGTDRLTIGGESTGARLSVVTLVRLKQRHAITGAFRGAMLSFGGYDLSMTPSARRFGDRNLLINTPTLHWFHEKSFPGLDPEQLRAPDISPLYADLTDLPPARFSVGTNDPVLDDTLFMAARWAAAGNRTELEVIAEAWHGFTLQPTTVARRELAAQDEFVRTAVQSIK
ncbi:acetyl esterase/lipase [Hamadaea flava]|uniref:Alpha/beta hydrolase n=1 Tax=Hamadaea flava TaxID=1742688 RepID=A0ABV8LU60_9ACTN|nr:alpha/beta hydrolase [Hamadaea flava]MCP2328317.1 acetyl esterase/lipase [Hamadaea flava]